MINEPRLKIMAAAILCVLVFISGWPNADSIDNHDYPDHNDRFSGGGGLPGKSLENRRGRHDVCRTG